MDVETAAAIEAFLVWQAMALFQELAAPHVRNDLAREKQFVLAVMNEAGRDTDPALYDHCLNMEPGIADELLKLVPPEIVAQYPPIEWWPE